MIQPSLSMKASFSGRITEPLPRFEAHSAQAVLVVENNELSVRIWLIMMSEARGF
jgi:hypothetical protein